MVGTLVAHPRGVTELHDPQSRQADMVERLRAALDGDALAKSLSESPWAPMARGTRLLGCEVARVFPRGKKGFVIAYRLRLETAGQEWCESLHGELVPGDPQAHLKSALHRLGRVNGEPHSTIEAGDPIICFADLGLVVRRQGVDEALSGFSLLHCPSEAVPILAAHGFSPPNPIHTPTAALLGHRLGRRGVVRFSWPGVQETPGGPGASSVVAKMFEHRRSNPARTAYDVMQDLWRSGLDGREGIRVPKTFGHAADQDTVFMEDIPGTQLPRLGPAAMDLGMAAAGRALASLHRCQVDSVKSHGAADEIELLEKWIALLDRVRPELRSLIGPALGATRLALAQVDAGQVVTLHRDFHPDQVFVDGETTILIDFDTLCLGDPALDLGNFLAHLRLAELQGGLGSAPLIDTFLAAYGDPQHAGSDQRIEAYTKSALLRLACIYAVSTRWRHLAGPMLKVVS